MGRRERRAIADLEARLAAAGAEAQRQRQRADQATQGWASAAAQRDTLASELRLARHALLAARNRAYALAEVVTGG